MNADEDEDDVIAPLKQRVMKNPIPNMELNFLKANQNRELGTVKKNSLKYNLQAYAEDQLVRKEYKELKCEMPGTPRSTFLMVFSPDGSKVASTHGNHNIYVTDLRTGKHIKTLIGHPRTPWCIAFHPTSNDLVASGCLGGQVRIWDLSGGSEVWTSERETVISSIAFHPTDRLVVIATFHELFFWDWSRPEPFLHTTTSNAKEKVRYVAFDKLGHKLITGIANSPQSHWERTRVSVPLSERSGSPYRRRIFTRPSNYSYLSPPSTSNTTERPSVSSVPERERRITACYRNLVHEYELLVHRYLQIYRPPSTMDRGTDPMDLDQQASTSSAPVAGPSHRSVDYQEPGPSTSGTASGSSTMSSSTSRPSPNISRLMPRQNNQEQTRGTQTLKITQLHPIRNTQEQTRGTQWSSTSESRKRKLPTSFGSQSSNPSISEESVTIIPENRELANATEVIQSNSVERNPEPLPSTSSTSAAGSSNTNISSPPKFKRCLILHSSTPKQGNVESSESSNGTSSAKYNIYRMRIKCSPKQTTSSSPESTPDDLVNLKEKLAEIQKSLAEASKRQEGQDQENTDGEPSTSSAITDPNVDAKAGEGTSRGRESSHLKRLYPGFVKKSNRRLVLDTSSDSSSDEEECRKKRLFVHRNYTNATSSSNQNVPVSESQETNRNSPPLTLDSLLQNVPHSSAFNITRKPECSTHVHSASDSNTNMSNGNAPDSSPNSDTPIPNAFSISDGCARATQMTSRADTEPCARTLMNTDTRTTNSTVYTPSGNRRRFFSQRFSAFYPTRVYNVRSQSRLRRATVSSFLSPTLRQMIDELETFDADNNRLPVNLAPDEVINYSERVNAEDDPTEQASAFHPFDPPPDVPSINPENIGIGNMYSNIVQDLEVSLRNVRNIRASNRPGETSDMLSSFSERLESIMQQSNSILRNLRNTMDMLPPSTRSSDSNNQYSSRATERPHFAFNDPNFYVRDHSQSSPTELNDSSSFSGRSPITTDHTYPRNPEYPPLPPSSENMTPLMTSLHLTISHIQRQAGLLRRQVESIERIDRAMLEVAQLQMIRQMFEELRQHVNTIGSNDTRSGVSSVRQMMAGTRISDTSPYDSPNETNEQQSTDASAPETESTRSSGTAQPTTRSNVRKSYLPSRLLHLQRQNRRFSIVNFAPPRRVPTRERFLRRRDICRELYRSIAGRQMSVRAVEEAENSSATVHLSTEILNIMVRRLEQLLTDHIRLIGLPPHLQPVPVRDNREHVVIERLNRCRLRLNQTLGRTTNSNMHPSYRIEVSSATQDSMLRFGAREAMSLILNTFTRFFETTTNVNFTQSFRTHIRAVVDLSLLLSDVLLLHIIDSIPPPTGMNLDPERESLSARIDQACSRLLRNYGGIQSHLSRSLRIMRLTTRYASRALEQTYNTRRNTAVTNSNNSEGIRELLGRMNETLHNMHAIRGMSYSSTEMPPRSTEAPMRDWHRTTSNQDDLTNSDDDVDTSFSIWYGGSNRNNNDAVESSETSNSESGTSSNNNHRNIHLENNRPLYGQNSTNSVNRDDPSNSSSSSQGRTWNVPTVQINDVPVSEPGSGGGGNSDWQNRVTGLRLRLSEMRANVHSMFRPRFFLLPPFGGVNVNPLESDIEDAQREQLNEGDMVMAVTPNHRIQAWDISTGIVPDINNAFKNVVVSECKIHNDASVDISNDGNILVTLLPSRGYLNYSNRLGVYSLRWKTLGQCLYITSFEQNAVSVSLSPLSRHLVVGLASRRSIIPSERWTMARIFLIEKKKMSYGNRMINLRDIDQHRDTNFMSLNCIRWLPISGQGLIYATNTGQLRVLS